MNYERNQEVWVSMEALGNKGIQRGRYRSTIKADKPSQTCHNVVVEAGSSPKPYRSHFVHGTYHEAALHAEKMRLDRIERMELEIDRLYKLKFTEI